jgi:hypothetical protein
MCYAFFKDGTGLCTDVSVEPYTFRTIHSGVNFRPSVTTQDSFPTFAKYPAKPPGTFFRQFALPGAPLIDAGTDFTSSISASFIQSSGYAPVADNTGDNIFYLTAFPEPSSNLLVWQFHRISASNPQMVPEVVQAFGGLPEVSAACGGMATANYLYIGVQFYIGGQPMNYIYQGNIAKRPVVWENAVSLLDIFKRVNPQPRGTDFICTTTTRAMAVGDDGFGYLLMAPVSITYPVSGAVNGAARLIRFDPNRLLQPQLETLTSANWYDPLFVDLQTYNQFGYGAIAKIGPRLYVSIANTVIYWNLPSLPNPFTDTKPGMPVTLTQVPDYSLGFFTVFGNTQKWSMLLTPGFKANTLWVMFSGHTLLYDLSTVNFKTVEQGTLVTVPVDPYNDQKTSPYVYKNVSMAWSFGLCDGKLYNLTATNQVRCCPQTPFCFPLSFPPRPPHLALTHPSSSPPRPPRPPNTAGV